MPLYTTGTATTTAGSKSVIGTGTAWTDAVPAGSILVLSGAYMEVESVEDDTHLTLVDDAAATASGPYTILVAVDDASHLYLMRKVEEYLSQRYASLDEFEAWMSGTPTGGPNGDGTYPITDRYGNTVYLKTPAVIAGESLQTEFGGLDDKIQQVNDQATLASQKADAAATSATAASTAATTAQNAAQSIVGALPESVTIASAGTATTLAIDPGLGDGKMIYDMTLDQPSCTLTFGGSPIPEGKVWSFTCVFRQGTGANKVVYPGTVKWGFGREPVLAYTQGKADIVTFMSDPLVEGGWFGFHEVSWL